MAMSSNMSLMRWLFVSLVYFSYGTLASDLVKSEYCVAACERALSYVTFSTSDNGADHYVNECSDRLRIDSMYLCTKIYCTEKEQKSGLQYLNKECRTKDGIDLPDYQSFISNITEKALQEVPRFALEDVSGIDKVINTFVPNEELYSLAYRTVVGTNQRMFISRVLISDSSGRLCQSSNLPQDIRVRLSVIVTLFDLL
jgi:hypothetical protein